jgi:hypothetical protein
MMRSLSLMLPATLLLAASAGAQTQDQPSTAPEAGSRVQVTAPAQPYKFYGYEAESISGAYAMSNGWHLKVDPSREGIVAQIDKRHPIKLAAVAPDRYASGDGNIAMEFNRGDYGDQMLMSYVPDPRTAQVVVVGATATLAQR